MNPINDRHWAQHNLIVETVKQKKIIHLPFIVVNALHERETFEVLVQSLYESEIETLAERLKATPRIRM